MRAHRVIIGLGLVLALSLLVQRLTPESAPVARGAAYAHDNACIDCHGDPGNPGIDANDGRCSHVNSHSWHPDYDVKCADAMAYFEVIRLARTFNERAESNPDGRLIAGERLAREYHCFQCHGPLGQGGFANAKSLKGYVPGYFGKDFKQLTRNGDPDSIREWITDGEDSTLVEKPIIGHIAAFFFERQTVHMPSYDSLSSDEIETLVNYVITLHAFGPMTPSDIRVYSNQSRT